MYYNRIKISIKEKFKFPSVITLACGDNIVSCLKCNGALLKSLLSFLTFTSTRLNFIFDGICTLSLEIVLHRNIS